MPVLGFVTPRRSFVSAIFSGFWRRNSCCDDASFPHGLAGPISRLLLPPDRRHHGLDAEDVERPSQIIDERREAELGGHIVEASHWSAGLFDA
jgi:hypothetical protein